MGSAACACAAPMGRELHPPQLFRAIAAMLSVMNAIVFFIPVVRLYVCQTTGVVYLFLKEICKHIIAISFAMNGNDRFFRRRKYENSLAFYLIFGS